jgi:hypothetical protein
MYNEKSQLLLLLYLKKQGRGPTMGETNLQLGGGYKYQWEIAVHLALDYFSEKPLAFNQPLNNLINSSLGNVVAIQLEGVEKNDILGLEQQDLGKDRELEDINLFSGEKRILIQVKAKEAEGKQWTLSDDLLLKALSRFYKHHLSDAQPENTRYVFLTNQSFNTDLKQLINLIETDTITQYYESNLTAAGKLFNYVTKYLEKKGGKTQVTFDLFRKTLLQTSFVDFLPIDSVEASIKAKLQALGRSDWEQTYPILFTEFVKKSTHKGGEIVDRDSLNKILNLSYSVPIADSPPINRGSFHMRPAVEKVEVFGRNEEIQAVINFFTTSTQTPKSFITIIGAPGIGKTTVALEAYEQVPYKYKLWFSCGNYFNLKELWQDIASEFRKSEVTLQSFTELLEKESILLVLDGVDTNSQCTNTNILDGLKVFLSKLRPNDVGKVVLTANRSLGFDSELEILLNSLSEKDAQMLFVHWWGEKWDELDQADKIDVKSICNEYLGNHPQFIRWAGQKAKGKRTFKNLIHLLKEPEMLPLPKDITDDYQYMRPVQLAFEQLPMDAKKLLGRMCLLGNTVKEKDVAFMARLQPKISNYESVKLDIEELHLVYLSKENSDTYIIHQNVQSYVIYRYLSHYPEIKQLKTAAAQRLLQSRYQPNWMIGLGYLYEAERWLDVVRYAAMKFDIVENKQIFPDGDTSLRRERAHWVMAYLNYRLRNFQAAIEYADCREKIKPNPKNAYYFQMLSLILRFNNILAYCYLNEGDESMTQNILEDSEKIITTIKQPERDLVKSEIAQYNLMLGVYERMRMEGDINKAQSCTELALKAFSELGDEEYKLKAISNLATIYSFDDAQLERSIDLSIHILDHLHEKVDSFTISVEYTNLVWDFLEVGNYEDAFKYVELGIQYSETHGQIGALKVLLLNGVDVDAERNDPVRGREKMTHVQNLLSTSERNDQDNLSIDAGWVKILILESENSNDVNEKEQKRKEAENFFDEAKRIAEESINTQDKEVINKLIKWMNKHQ